MRGTNPPVRGGRGTVLVYATAGMIVLVLVASLAVDLGRVQLTRTELQRAADAAARHAATGLSDGTAASKASYVANQNSADGTPVVLVMGGGSNDDVVVGHWDGTAFVSGGTPTDAVRVTVRRTAARGNAVPLALAAILGQRTCDVTATATAVVTGSGGYAVVGLNYINMQGNAVDSYWSSSGYAPGGTQGSIASNGNITLNGTSAIHGDARPGVGKTVTGASNVFGSTAPLASPLVCPNGDPGTAATTNSNSQIPPANAIGGGLVLGSGSNVTLPGGNYYLSGITMSGSATLSFSGPATVYCYGTVTMNGNVATSGSLPGNFKLVMVPTPTGGAPGTISVGSSASLYATVYAPQSDVTLGGGGAIYGSVVGKSVSMTGSAAIHYDLTLGGGGGTVSMVN